MTMLLTDEQAKVRALLAEAITVLCKNGLTYRTEFCVEGLLGITLDNEDVFLISINETIKSDLPTGAETIHHAVAPTQHTPIHPAKRPGMSPRGRAHMARGGASHVSTAQKRTISAVSGSSSQPAAHSAVSPSVAARTSTSSHEGEPPAKKHISGGQDSGGGAERGDVIDLDESDEENSTHVKTESRTNDPTEQPDHDEPETNETDPANNPASQVRWKDFSYNLCDFL